MELTKERRERWKGLKEGTRGTYVDAARRFANICEQEGVDAWPVTASALEAVAVSLGITRLPSTDGTEINRIRLFCAAMGITYPARAELHGLRLILRGQTRRAWRSTIRATPLRAKHLLAFTRRWCRKGDASKVQLAAMLWLGHSALLRAQELLRLRWGDITITRFCLRVKVRAENSKTSVGGPGDVIWVPKSGSEARKWLSE